MKILIGALAGSLVFASAAMAHAVTVQHESNAPIPSPTNETPQQNVRLSNQYQAMVDRNAGFRNARMHKECDPIASPELRQECMNSFGNGGNSYGSSGMSDRNGRAR